MGMFDEDWTRYVMKLATGAGKTKVMSLLIAWSYFHKHYEEGSDLSTNFLLIAPNIIVLDRLRLDFDGTRIFHDDPILPPNGHAGQNWEGDFQLRSTSRTKLVSSPPRVIFSCRTFIAYLRATRNPL